MSEEIEMRKLDIELEKIRIERDKYLHHYKMEELKVRKEIAEIYRNKKCK